MTAAVFDALIIGTGQTGPSLADVFRPLVADPAEPRFFVSVLSVDRSSDKLTVGSIGGGVSFGLYRWPGERADEGWQVGIFGSITSQFDLGSSSDDLINADYRVGFPLSCKRGDFSGRAPIFHNGAGVQFDL